MKTRNLPFILIIAFVSQCFFAGNIFAQAKGSTAFKTIVLGSGGGIEEDNLSAYLLAPKSSNDYICLDAGTVYHGIGQAVKLGNFYDVFLPDGFEDSKTGYVFRELIKGYLISHAHLDHFAGLVISSPASKPSQIYGRSQTIEFLKENVFNWQIWPNFANEGAGMNLGVFDYKTLIPELEQHIEGTKMKVTAFPLSHQNPYESTAFLVEYFGEFVLYIGDTGADELEGSTYLNDIWQVVAPLIREGQLHAIFLECSYPEARPDTKLFGHLSPKWVLTELHTLAQITDEQLPTEALRGIPIIVTGIKPSWKENGDNKYLIYRQLLNRNDLGVKFIIPEQGQLIEF